MDQWLLLGTLIIGVVVTHLILRQISKRVALARSQKNRFPLPTIEGKNWEEWYKQGLREEAGAALGAALRSFETALELYPNNSDILEARLRVAKHYTHIEYYRDLVAKSQQ